MKKNESDFTMEIESTNQSNFYWKNLIKKSNF